MRCARSLSFSWSESHLAVFAPTGGKRSSLWAQILALFAPAFSVPPKVHHEVLSLPCRAWNIGDCVFVSFLPLYFGLLAAAEACGGRQAMDEHKSFAG